MKQQLYKVVRHLRYKLFLKQRSKSYSPALLNSAAVETDRLDVVTIAFNNAAFIEKQILLVRKFLVDPHCHIVADNSSDFACQQEIRSICDNYQVLYVKVPFIKLKPSHSHAAALHWVFVNVLLKRNASFFGFLDHDIFPVRTTSVLEKMWNGVYGRVLPPYGTTEISPEQRYWSLWAGFMFFSSTFFKGNGVRNCDFFPRVLRPGLVLDTGGGLWDVVFSKLPLPPQLVAYEEVVVNSTSYTNIQTDSYEKIDDWIHVVNLSNWYQTDNMDQKLQHIDSVIDVLLHSE